MGDITSNMTLQIHSHNRQTHYTVNHSKTPTPNPPTPPPNEDHDRWWGGGS